MQIHFFISEDARAGDRLKTRLHEFMQTLPVIQYHSLEAIGLVIPRTYQEPIVALIMLAHKKELIQLVEKKYIQDQFKTILVLPDNDLETTKLGLALGPVIITQVDSDFSEVSAILAHIKERCHTIKLQKT